jgi:hypothetical protein
MEPSHTDTAYTSSFLASEAAANEANQEYEYRQQMEAKHGQVWNTQELTDDFKVIAFSSPIVMVVRRADNVKGSLWFDHRPRFYYGFDPIV